jgi:hypothetical protein
MRRRAIVGFLAVSLAGCSSKSPTPQSAVERPSVFATCLSSGSNGSAQPRPTKLNTRWETTTKPNTILSVTFVPLQARSIWNGNDITAATINAAFYPELTTAAAAAAAARQAAPANTIQLRLNAVIAFSQKPSVLQQSLINGCLVKALKFSPHKPST